MEFISRNKRKKSNKVGLSFNINNATKTFKRLIEKHKNEKKVEKKISTNKIDDFFSTLNNAFFKQEIKESDYDYIFREIKNQIRISQNLVDLYGINATRKVYKRPREPIRFDKHLVFNPIEENSQSKIRYTSFINDNKNKKEKKLDLPCIIKKNIKISDTPKNTSVKKMPIETVINNEHKKKKKLKLKKHNNIKTESNQNNDDNHNMTVGNEKYVPINYFYKTNNDIMNLKKNINNNNNTFTIGNQSNINTNRSFDKNEYVTNLDTLNDQIKMSQRRHRRYFNSNDYGCTLSKNKYNYISKYFFN